MNCLYHLHDTDDKGEQDSKTSWVSSWLRRYAQSSLTKYEQLAITTEDLSGSPKEKDNLEIMFHEEKNLSAVDKLCQVTVCFVSQSESVSQSICPFIHSSVCLSFIHWSICLLVLQLVSPSVHQSMSPTAYQSISPSVHQSISWSACQSIS